MSSRKRRSGHPKITSITPRNASPNGGVLITIFGENLKSKQIDIGGQKSESEDQGENFRVWFSREINGVMTDIPCDIDRMLGLHVRMLPGQDFLVCQSRPFRVWGNWWIRLSIDDGPTINSHHINFNEGEAPSANYFFPSASSPAKPAGIKSEQS